MNRKKQHAPLKYFQVKNNILQIGDQSLTRLISTIGRTPFYAYDRNVITEKVTHLRKLLPDGIKLHYAMKANPMPEIVQHMAGLVDGLGVASAGELEVALTTATKPYNISFAGPGKREEELSYAIRAGIIINMESEREMRTIAEIASQSGIKAKVAIRVNPDFELKLSGMKMGGRATQFGVDAERVPELLKQLDRFGLDFYGFHIFSGSQNLLSEAIIEAHNKTIDLALQLSEHAPGMIRLLNIGGGFGIPYFPGDEYLDVAPIADNLKNLLPAITNKLPDAEVVIELGRYFVGEAGIYVCQILDKKVSRGQVFLITDGGLHHHLAASGNFGQVIRKNYPVAIGNRMENTDQEVVNIVGPLCTPLDTLADKMLLPKANAGDYVVVFQSGAYGFTASPTAFLSHPNAVEVLV
ncbi:MAG: pyridoxal-dependent decarboxylase, exosortase A system-associated [Gammaproteobacteria bacterium]|nr:MAG: pyridoxal-dependent decarboxylase, exosortase A system-associated [Gammaproteobacteria bacterium]